MSVLSIWEDGVFVIASSPIFIISKPDEFHSGSEIIFEVFEEDATALKAQIGNPQYYALGSSPFWAKLKSLEPCESTHPGLASLRHKTTLRGVFSVIEELGRTQ